MNRPLLDLNDSGSDETIRNAEELGFRCIPQWWAVTSVTDESGQEWALSVGPLRYTPQRAHADAQAANGPAAVAWIVRFSDPESPGELEDYKRHVQAREAERRGE